MQYTSLGSSGMQVSRLALGTMTFGGRADRAESERLYRIARERGINLFDCANVYGRGEAERTLGALIKGEREHVVITTKAHSPMSDDPNDRGCSAKNLTQSLHQSLKRLDTDYIDLFFLHGYDEATGDEEILATMQKFVLQGKILSFGVSNYSAWQTQRLITRARAANLPLVQCIQPMYNLAKRTAEIEILPMARSQGIGVITYSPLGGGLLTGRYIGGREPSVRLAENPRYKARYRGRGYEQIAAQFLAFANELAIHPATLAVSWILANEAVTAPILGAANTEQLTPSLAALEYPLTAEILSRLDAISLPPAPFHDRTEMV
ncbi:MAG: aldo/keto reductase [Sphaerochaeta sp.]|jgi:aryl-alcohol dehydrogenase-like predicted oxidoreductase|nr:aldo/keto reductase [Sphaerochaeta sp.]